jgi:triphosphoribosyl-dephospho-CoA synthase
LEATAHKPGNVNSVSNFEKTRYENFLASAVVAASSFEEAASRGIAVAEGKIDLSNLEVGNLIKSCITEIDAWQKGGNTLLGTVILLLPIAVAAGMISTGKSVDVAGLRSSVKRVVESTTPKDAVDVYEAIRIANPGGLGKTPDLDINDSNSRKRILDEKISLFQIFQIAEKYDRICSEWVNNYPVTFDLAYPSLARRLHKNADPNASIVQTFLEVLAEFPDTLIARKTDMKKARQISLKAREILELGGVDTPRGRNSLSMLDRELRVDGNLLNPGTTADIIAAAVALAILYGYRP